MNLTISIHRFVEKGVDPINWCREVEVASSRRSRRWRKRWVLVLVFLLVTVAAGALAATRLWVRGSDKGPQQLDLLYNALAEFNAKRFDQANAILDRRAAEVAPTPLDWMLRARIGEAQGRLTDALDYLKHIPESDPISSQAWLKAGQIELASGQGQAAEAAFLHTLALNPDQIQPYRELAYLYAIQRRKLECDAQFRALDRRIQMDYVLAFSWCQNSCQIWDPREAGKVLKKLVEVDPSDRWSRLALAVSHRLTNNLDEAEAALRPLGDSDPEARAIRVQIAIDRGEIAVAKDLLQAGPAGHARLDIFRGQLALNARESLKAAAYFRAALGQEPDDRDAIHGLGVALRSVGDPEATKFLQLATRHDQLKQMILNSVSTLESDRKLFYKLGEGCESIDRIRQAHVWYRLAVERDPLDTRAHEALNRLEQALQVPNSNPIVNPERRNPNEISVGL
jgi:tetratricopeptide (TPR) repeat protein